MSVLNWFPGALPADVVEAANAAAEEPTGDNIAALLIAVTPLLATMAPRVDHLEVIADFADRFRQARGNTRAVDRVMKEFDQWCSWIERKEARG